MCFDQYKTVQCLEGIHGTIIATIENELEILINHSSTFHIKILYQYEIISQY